MAHRKELGSARCNQNFSSNGKPAQFFFVFSILVDFLYFFVAETFWPRFSLQAFTAQLVTTVRKKTV